MIEVKLARIIIDEGKKEQVIVLKEKKGSRMLPIVIGMPEAAAIRAQLSGNLPPRPLTHDLFCAIMHSFEVTLEKVVIDKLVDSTFHAKIYFKSKEKVLKIIDARPSDSIALAVRTKSPIFLEEQILHKLSQEV
ncbi:MAG: bifunctional nuclease family protein [Candidatus Omnitrophica bacterium]|nr:bifunctional nuclease family protein [Candidatus Omnitrophota bacterium]